MEAVAEMVWEVILRRPDGSELLQCCCLRTIDASPADRLNCLRSSSKGRRNNNLDESTEGILSKPEVRECSSSPDECCAVVGQARPFVSLTL